MKENGQGWWHDIEASEQFPEITNLQDWVMWNVKEVFRMIPMFLTCLKDGFSFTEVRNTRRSTVRTW